MDTPNYDHFAVLGGQTPESPDSGHAEDLGSQDSGSPDSGSLDSGLSISGSQDIWMSGYQDIWTFRALILLGATHPHYATRAPL